MKEDQQNEDAAGARAETRAGVSRGLRELFVLRAGARRFAVFREEVEATAGGLRAAPLPFAPAAVIGVVALRGRVRTALDPVRLVPARADETPAAEACEADAVSARPPRLFVALAGDEQLALACDAAEEPFTISTEELRPAHDPAAPARGLVTREGSEVLVLDPALLLDAALRGRDRRRRRS